MNALQMNRISPRKISYDDLAKKIGEDKKTTKKLHKAVSDLLSDAGIEDRSDDMIEKILSSISFLNLKSHMNIYDRDYNLAVEAVIDSNGNKLINWGNTDSNTSLVLNTDERDAFELSDILATYISPWDELALDIYKGTRRFNHLDCIDYMKEAVEVINAAADNDDTFRRDIFSVESASKRFIPLDVICLATHSDKMKYIPYVTGILYRYDGVVSAKAIELSLTKVCTKSANEFILDDGSIISLANAKNLFIELVSKDTLDGFRKDLLKSVEHLTAAKICKLQSTSIDLIEMMKEEFDKIVWIDDDRRAEAPELNVPEFVGN